MRWSGPQAKAVPAVEGSGEPRALAGELPEMLSTAITVFLSYSRADGELLSQLATALEREGYRPNYDIASASDGDVEIGISAQDDWWRRLQQMIVGADVVVLLVSPDSARSRVVDEEIAFAREQGKRIVPILCRPIDFATAPPRLAALNVGLSFVDRSPEAFARSMPLLCKAIEQDVDWLRLGRGLAQKAHEWREASREQGRLLHGAEIAEAERWSARRPATAPAIAESLLTYIAESRSWDEELVRRERAHLARQARMQRWVGALVAAAVVATLAGAGFVLAGRANLARSESVMLARVAEELYTRGDYARAMRIGALGERRGVLRPGSDDADQVFRRAAASPVLVREFGPGASITQSWLRPDGAVAVLAGSGGDSLGIWHPATGEKVAGSASLQPVSDVGFAVDPTGRRVLSWAMDLNNAVSFAGGDAEAAATFATLWTLDAKGALVALRQQRHPAAGGVLTSAEGPILTWSLSRLSRLSLWSPGLERLLDESTVPGRIEMARSVEDGRRVLVALAGGRVQSWSLGEPGRRAALHRSAEGALGATVRDVVDVPAAKTILVVTQEDELLALDSATLAIRYRHVQHLCCLSSPQVHRLAFPGGEEDAVLTVVSGKGAQFVRLSNGLPLGPLFAHPGIRGANFDAQGRRIVTYGTDEQAMVWDVATGIRRVLANQHDELGALSQEGPPGGILGASFMADGDRLVTWSYDGTIRVYAATTGRQLGGPMRHDSAVRGVLIMPGARLLTTSDGPARVWQLPRVDLPIDSVDALCASPWPTLDVVRLSRKEAGGVARSSSEFANERAAVEPALTIDDLDVRLAPILRERLGETVCGQGRQGRVPARPG